MSSDGNPAPDVTIRELGIPVRAVFHAHLHPGADAAGKPSLLISMGQHAGGFLVLEVDVKAGTCRQHECQYPHAFEATASFRSPTTGVLYCGSCYTGWLHRFAPGDAAITDIAPVDEKWATFPCRIDEAPDGCLYVGAYPGCCLSRYNPKSGEWTRFGRMDDTDMYFYPLCGSDGTVAGLVRMCRPHVVALDPATGEHRAVGPVLDTQQQSGDTLELFKGADGLLYIKSSAGHFRVSGLDAIPVRTLPEPLPAPRLPGGEEVAFVDAASFQYRHVVVRPVDDGTVRNIHLDWRGAGTDLFMLHHGPDGRIYGSSILPEHLFSCKLDGSDMVNHGQCSVSGGEAYSMGNLDGKLYIASYPAARLSIYSPAQPYHFGTGADDNPRDIGRPDAVAFRPRVMAAGPLGKVWIGSIPDYGMWGGTLAAYDPNTGKFESHRHLVHDCSVTALAWLPDRGLFLVGTSVEGGTGTLPKAKSAAFVLWDPQYGRALSQETFGLPPIYSIVDLAYAAPGFVYAAVVYGTEPANLSAEVLLLDLVHGRVQDRSALGGDEGWPHEVSFTRGPGNCIYGATFVQLYRFLPGTAQRQTVWRTSLNNVAEHIRTPGPIVGHTFYFGRRHRLMAMDIP